MANCSTNNAWRNTTGPGSNSLIAGWGCIAANAVVGTKRLTPCSWHGFRMCSKCSPPIKSGTACGISPAISGILDSRREDVEYEEWHGHKLDRKLLDLLK